jgi:hypothetical protein
MTETLTLNGSGANLGTATLASVGPAPSASIAYTNRDIPSSDGIVHTDGVRSFGTVTLGGLPSGVTAPGSWAGYLVRLTNSSDSVMAESGSTTAAPTTTVSGGTVSYWNGAGYTNLTVATGNPVSIPVGAVHLNYKSPPVTGPTITVDITATLTTGGTSKTDPANCGASCTRTQSSATSSSPIVGDITYAVSYGGTSLCSLTIHVDLGALTAKTNYTAAPVA